MAASPTTQPAAANAPSIPSTRPRTSGVVPRKTQPSRMARQTLTLRTASAAAPSRFGISSRAIVAAETRKVAALKYSASSTGLVARWSRKLSRMPFSRARPANTRAATGAEP